MKTRHKRMALIGGIVAAVGVAAALVLNAFQSNLVFFYSPSQVAAKEAPQGRAFRIGGWCNKAASSATAPRCIRVPTPHRRCRAFQGILPTCSKRAKASSRRPAVRRRRVRGARGAGQARRELHAAGGQQG
jgi:cytochrome c-type biogenesis protein CcmE